jgi:hypothetical protein
MSAWITSDTIYTTSTNKKSDKEDVPIISWETKLGVSSYLRGRTFLRRILDVIKQLLEQGHTARVSKEVKEDMTWWLTYLEHFNGTMQMVDNRTGAPVTIDACNNAAGGVFGQAFFCLPWNK